MSKTLTRIGDGSPSTVVLTEQQFKEAKRQLLRELASSVSLVAEMDSVAFAGSVSMLQCRVRDLKNIVDQLENAEVKFD